MGGDDEAAAIVGKSANWIWTGLLLWGDARLQGTQETRTKVGKSVSPSLLPQSPSRAPYRENLIENRWQLRNRGHSITKPRREDRS